MNLGIVTPQLSHYGGAEIYLLECLKRWQREVDITLYTGSVNRRLFDEFGIDRKIKVVTLPSSIGGTEHYAMLEQVLILPHIWEQKLSQHDLYFLYLFPTQMIRRRPSVWFAAEPLRMLYDLRHTAYSPDGNINVHFYPKLNYDVINASHLDVLLQLIERIDSAPDCDRWVTNSGFMARYLENVYARKPDLVVYPGVTAPPRVRPAPATKRALSVGRLWKHKRVDLILKAFALIPEGELVVVGDGPEKPFLRRLRTELGLTKRVHLLGDIGKRQLDRLFASSTCCVYTPIMEPFGMVPLEAAAAGRPVVGTLGCGYSEILNGSLARLVPANPERLAQAIQHLFDHPNVARELGEASRRAVAPYTWDRTAETLLQVFRDTRRQTTLRRKAEQKPEIGAHYYPWYRAGAKPEHWNENMEFAPVTDMPLGGAYSSTSPVLIRRHLRMATEAGLDFFVVNLQVTFQGLNSTEMKATRTLFRIIEDDGLPFKLSLMVSVAAEDPQVIGEAIETVREEFMASPVYHKSGGRPLFWYYLSGPFMGYFFFHHGDLVHLNRGLHPIAAGALVYNKFLPRLLREFFSGWCLYSPLELGQPTTRKGLWVKGYRDFHEDRKAVRIFSVCPGYDDSRIQSYDRMHNRRRIVSRRGLKTYQEMQECACRLDPSPDLVVITSFNEFHENTHIEPSERFGETYLKSTRAFSARLKNSL
ncbi:MAG TPA: glycosyltransferase [Gemmatimonadales bacterium]|nr:glycosyltransferase [Gemmatimonadales bacterium]